ncbi:hypothetical protein SRABI128_04988 [Microbacterium sp. Bi128]|nr:hypothetical protein SRABI128_04988 [Microbacterium sp. Bi128]
MFGPQPLDVRRPALVQPDVLPVGRAHRVSEPLVTEFVHHRVFVRNLRVDRPRLRLQRIVDRVVVDNRAEGLERVPPELALKECDHLGLQRKRRLRLGQCRSRHVRVDRIDDGQPVRTDVVRQGKVADVRRRQIAGHRVRGLPRPRGPSRLRRRPADGQAVRHGRLPRRHRDAERIGRLVFRVVIHGVPGRRTLGLIDDHRTVSGCDPTVERSGGVERPAGDSAVLDHDRRRLSGLQLRPQPDREFPDPVRVVLHLGPLGGLAVDPDRRDAEAAQVEVERLQVLLRTEGDSRDPAEAACEHRGIGWWRIAEGEVVVQDVVAAVAGEREIRVPAAGSARRVMAVVVAGGGLRSPADCADAGHGQHEDDRCPAQAPSEVLPHHRFPPSRSRDVHLGETARPSSRAETISV